MSDSQHNRSNMVLTRRGFLRTVAAAGAGVVLAACGGSTTTPQSAVPTAGAGAAPTTGGAAAPTTSAPAAGGAQKVTISLWTHDQLYVKFFTSRGEEWKKTKPEYSNITFDFQQAPDVFTKVLANLAAGQEVPDLLGIEQGQFPKFMKDDIIEQKFVDLTPRIGEERNKFVEASWTKFTHKGKLYGVDSSLCASVLYYQPALLEKAGVKVPETWEDVATVGEALAKQGTAFMVLDGEGWGVFTELFLQRGGAFFDKDSKFVLNDPANRNIALEVLGFLKNGLDKKFIKPFSAADYWAPPAFAAYKDGSVNGAVMPDWYSDAQIKAQVPDMSGKWRMARMPLWKAGGHKTSTWGGTGFAIAQSSKNVDLVWDLLHYTYMTKESQIKRYEEIKYYPTMIDALQDPRISGVTDPYFGDQQVGKLFAEIAPDVPVWYQSPARDPMNDALNAQLTQFYNGQVTAEQAIDSVVSTTEQEMPTS